MSLNTGTDRSRDNWDETRGLTGKKLSPWLSRLMDDRALPLAHRLVISTAMPPLASYVWQQVSRFKHQNSQLAGRVTEYMGRTSLQMTRLSTLKPIILSTMWQRLLDLPWLRRPQKRQNTLSRKLNSTSEKGQRVNEADKVYRNELPGMASFTGEEPELDPADKLYRNEFPRMSNLSNEELLYDLTDELYPMVIENLLSPPTARIGLPNTTKDSFHPTDTSLAHPQSKQIARKPEIKKASEPMTPYVNLNKTSSYYQVDKIHNADAQQVKTETNRLSEPTLQGQWLDRVLPPLREKSVTNRVPITRPQHITYQSVSMAQAMPIQSKPYLRATSKGVESGRQAVQQPHPNKKDNTAEFTDMAEEAIQNIENYAWPMNLEMETTPPYSLPNQTSLVKPKVEPKPVLERLSQPSILRTVSNLRESPVNWPILKKEPTSGLSAAEATSLQKPEIRQATWSLPLVSPLPPMIAQRVEPTYISEGSSGMAQSSITLPTVTQGDNIAIRQEPPTSLIKSYLTPKEHSLANIVYRQLESATADQTLAEPQRQYIKSFDYAPPPSRSETNNLQRKEQYYPPLSQYGHTPGDEDTHNYKNIPHKDIHRPDLELQLTSVASPTPSSKITSANESLPHVLQRTAYYGSQPVQELALAPVERQTEGLQSPPVRQEPQTENISGETSAPDIDNIARDVYRILRLRLTRERERALGLS